MKSFSVILLTTIALAYCIFSANAGNLRTARDLTEDDKCNYHGIFNPETNSCVCVNGYTTHDPLTGTECNYEQKKQLTAFLLSLFLGLVSAGRWYVGTYALAGIKLAISVLSACFKSCAIEKDSNGEYNIKNGCAFIVWLPFALSACAWWLADVIMFGMNDINDENGIEIGRAHV